MLAIGRALMARPKVLLLDEPSMGLSPVLTAEVFEKIQEINKNGMTVLLIEQNAKQAMKISDYTYVIVRGTNGIFGESALCKMIRRLSMLISVNSRKKILLYKWKQ